MIMVRVAKMFDEVKARGRGVVGLYVFGFDGGKPE